MRGQAAPESATAFNRRELMVIHDWSARNMRQLQFRYIRQGSRRPTSKEARLASVALVQYLDYLGREESLWRFLQQSLGRLSRPLFPPSDA